LGNSHLPAGLFRHFSTFGNHLTREGLWQNHIGGHTLALGDASVACRDERVSTYSACAIALIGKLPSTLADRSVPIELRRRRVDEIIEPFRFDRTGPLDQLASQAARWALDNAARVRGTEPTIPTGVVNRAADNWRPLLAISDIAGGDWPTRTRHAVQCLVTTGEDELSTGAALL
jgi:hypothetical protein